MKRKGKVPFDPKVFLFRNSRPLSPLQLSHDRGAIALIGIGFLGPNTPAARSQSAAAFVQRLREFG